MRGEHRQAYAAAEAFLREAKAEGREMEAGVARRVLGFVSLQLGDLQAARKRLERALSDYVRERDRETLFRFGNDTQVSATNFLALTEWHLGEFEHARRLVDESTRRARELGHAAALGSALFFRTAIESRRGDASATRMAVESLLALTEEHNLKTYTDLGRVFANWARGKLYDPEGGAVGLKEALASYLALGNRSGGPWFHGLLADLEAMRPDLDSALAAIDAGLALAEETGEHYTDPHLHRLRGDFLLMRVSRQFRARRGSFPDRDRGGQGARRARLCAAGFTRAGQAPPLDRPPGRGQSDPCARASRLFADAGNARNRRGAGAPAAIGVGGSSAISSTAKPGSRDREPRAVAYAVRASGIEIRAVLVDKRRFAERRLSSPPTSVGALCRDNEAPL